MSTASLTSPQDFPARNKCCYLNAASAALMFNRAAERTLGWQKDLADNGTINFDEVAEEQIFFDLHSAAAEMINASQSDIAGGSSATELLTSLAWSMLPSEGQRIIGTDAAHPSTVYPWQRIARHAKCEFVMARANAQGNVDPAELMGLIDPDTAIVIISHVEYRAGQKYDLSSIAKHAHEQGAYLVVDATQSAGQVPIDVKASGVDALVSSGYKWLCGPFGAAFMYLSPSLHTRLDPGLVGWRSHENMWEFRADRLRYPSSAWRFEASTMAYGCALGLAAAIKYLNKVGVGRIFEHNRQLSDLIGEVLVERGARILSPMDEEQRSSIISVDFPDRDTQQIANHLNDNNVVISFRMGAIRLSPHLYNNEGDVERLVDTLDQYGHR
jgi:cysteine desulfurase/selenocysteine lyase